jgi:hypothetical protein
MLISAGDLVAPTWEFFGFVSVWSPQTKTMIEYYIHSQFSRPKLGCFLFPHQKSYLRKGNSLLFAFWRF